MNITTKATNIVLSPAIEEYATKKFVVLHKYIGKADSSAGGQMELGKITKHHQSGEVFRAEINLHVKGKDFWTEATATDLYAAIDKARDEIVRMLRVHKEKSSASKRAGGRVAKKMLHRPTK